MKLATLGLLLGGVCGVSHAGILPIRQAPAPSCSPITLWQTVIVTETVTDTPGTVTILQQDPSSIANSMASVDTAQIQQSSQLNPISGSGDTEVPVFTHSVHVSGFEATELPNDGTSVFYVSKGSSTTDWSFKPSASIVAEVTTVTVLPVPAQSSARRDFSTDTTSVHIPFTSPPAGWNTTKTETTAIDATGTESALVPTGSTLFPSNSSWASFYSAPVTTVTSVITTQVITVTLPSPAHITDAASTGGYAAASANGDDSPVEIFDNGPLEKRQICTLISATIGGQVVSWCNNWSGHSILTYTSWETTVTVSAPPYNQPSRTSSSPVPAAPTQSCGESGPFVVDFEDLPVFSTTDNDTTDFPPIFNPYRHFYWGAGWSFVPPPRDPFPPHSGSRLAEFVQSPQFNSSGSPNAGLLEPSAFGCGPRNYNNNYWFNARSAWVGCDNNSTSASVTCDFVATGYQWDNNTQKDKVAVTQHFNIPPCPDFQNCHLRQINFNYQFYRLSRMSFYANVKGQVKSFWVDDLALSWFNNTCAAGLARIGSRKL